MFGVLLAFSGNFFGELSSSFGKRLLEKKELSMYLYGAINYFFITSIFGVIAYVEKEPLILGSGIGLLLVRIIFEIIQSEVQLRALQFASRTTFGFLRTLTIPLLLLVDLVLGYTMSFTQVVGIAIVTLSLLFMFSGIRLREKGFYFTLFSALNSVITISIYKYDITHFRPVAVEGFYVTLFLATYFILRSFILHGRNIFVSLRHPKFIVSAMGSSLATVFVSFAYQYGPASLVLAMVRASALFWSFIAGAVYFREGSMKRKFVTLSFLVIASFLML